MPGRRAPAAEGTSANSAGWLTATPNPSSAISGSSAHNASAPATMPATTAAWAKDTTTSRLRFSKRSTIAPASPAASTTGPHSANTSAETANADPVVCCTCRISGNAAMKSPRADTPAAPARRRRSRDIGRSSGAPVRAALVQRERCVPALRRPRDGTTVGVVLEVRLTGGLALRADGEALAPPASRRARAVLAYLALHPGPQARAQLAARLRGIKAGRPGSKRACRCTSTWTKAVFCASPITVERREQLAKTSTGAGSKSASARSCC